MADPYQKRRGELQSLGEILHAALKVADPNYYRPARPFSHARKKKQRKDNGKLRGVQLELFADNGAQNLIPLSIIDTPVKNFAAMSSAITPEHPITDEDVPF
jgi:hypothetical protein